ncbi:MAG: calcium/proton exchanger [Acidimicrobiales bacterium]|jgi:Ca2+:H+ antiporter
MPRPADALGKPQRLTIAAAGALTAAAGVMAGAGAPDVPRFAVAAVALAVLAVLVGESIEQIGERLGPGPTGLLQSSLGNLPELFVAIFALRDGLILVVQAALIGSVLGNVLLVLGAAFLSGGARHGAQRFRPEAPRMLVTLLALAGGATLVPTLAVRLETPAAHHAVALSDVAAIVLLAVYVTSIPFWLSGGPEMSSPPQAARARRGRATAAGTVRPQWPLGLAIGVLAGAGLASGAASDWFVSALTPATRSLGISPMFTGLVIVALASNAVENAAGIRFAWKARPDFAISTILNSPLQITLLLTPVLVLISPLLGPAHLTLVFPPLLVVALAVAVVVVAIVVYDGEYSWLEGVALIALYVIIAAALWWG